MSEASEVAGIGGYDISGAPAAARRRRRHAAELRLRIYGIVAISLAIGLLAVLLVTIFLNGRLAAFKVPAQMVFSDVPLPRLGTGKIDRVALKQKFAG